MNVPDKWVIVCATSNEFGQVYKVLGGWFGGYVDSEEWKLNSGIASFTETEDSYLFYGESGSVYKCYKQSEGFTSLTQSVFNRMQNICKKHPGASMEIISADYYTKP